MQLVEQHRIDRHDPHWKAIDEATFASKNLYNTALYVMRQQYIANHYVIPYEELDTLLSPVVQYQALPRKVAQWVLRQVCDGWKSYKATMVEYGRDPGKFLGHPKLPKYLDKEGRNLLIYTDQAVSRDPKNAGWIVPSGVDIRVPTKIPHAQMDQIRLVPKSTHFVVEVVYSVEPNQPPLEPTLIASIDIGVNNLAAITSNKPGFVPILVNGRPVKSVNQGYNKRRAKMQAELPKETFTSQALDHLTDHRTRSIMYYLHMASRTIIDLLVREQIGTLVIGKNEGWKQKADMGKKGNQRFVMIPHARFIELLQYKAALVGIQVITLNESHTSKCSFLDLEPIGHHEQYVGKRIKRGLFRSAQGVLLNSDVNGSYNILRRYAPDAFSEGVSACLLRPYFLPLPDRLQDKRMQRVRRKTSA
jgi:putative transposase